MAYGSGAGAYAAIAQATKASGVIVRLEPQEFLAVLNRIKDPLIVTAKSGWPVSGHQYLTSFKGLAFLYKIFFSIGAARYGRYNHRPEYLDTLIAGDLCQR
jgi:hypothetical protein